MNEPLAILFTESQFNSKWPTLFVHQKSQNIVIFEILSIFWNTKIVAFLNWVEKTLIVCFECKETAKKLTHVLKIGSFLKYFDIEILSYTLNCLVSHLPYDHMDYLRRVWYPLHRCSFQTEILYYTYTSSFTQEKKAVTLQDMIVLAFLYKQK